MAEELVNIEASRQSVVYSAKQARARFSQDGGVPDNQALFSGLIYIFDSVPDSISLEDSRSTSCRSIGRGAPSGRTSNT